MVLKLYQFAVRWKLFPKEKIGIRLDQKIGGPDNWGSMCSLVSQVMILNAENMLGLCISHETLFIKNCRAPITGIAVKDRVTRHSRW